MQQNAVVKRRIAVVIAIVDKDLRLSNVQGRRILCHVQRPFSRARRRVLGVEARGTKTGSGYVTSGKELLAPVRVGLRNPTIKRTPEMTPPSPATSNELQLQKLTTPPAAPAWQGVGAVHWQWH